MLELDVDQRAQLSECEAVIERGLQTFYEVGVALLTIRDQRLYRITHGTFEDYCRERWNMSRFYAHRVIEASKITDNLLPIGNAPTSESQVRPLAGLEAEDQRIVWNQAVEESNGQPTAAKVDEVKISLLDLIEQRRKLHDEKHADDTPSPETEPEPALTRAQLAQYREEAKRNMELNHKVFTFRGAIECFSEPAIDLAYVAVELAATDHQYDWTRQARRAQSNLEKLRSLLKKEVTV